MQATGRFGGVLGRQDLKHGWREGEYTLWPIDVLFEEHAGRRKRGAVKTVDRNQFGLSVSSYV